MSSEILIYQNQDGNIKVDVRLQDETVWLTQSQMAKLFGKVRSTITEHIQNVFKEGELSARQAEALVKSMQNKTPKAKAAKPQSTAEVRALMERLKLSLGSPVNIKFRAGKKVQGKIEIAFSSEAELERLIAYMDGQDQTEDTEVMEFRV